MRSKRFKKLPTNTSNLKANDFENVLKEVKKKLYDKIWWVNRFKYANQS